MNIQELILAGLQQKFAGADTATLARIATKKAEGVTDESQVQSIVEGISFMDVLQSYGDFRAGNATKTAVMNYEKQHNLKNGKPVDAPFVEPKQEQKVEEVPVWAQSLIEANKSLYEKLAVFEADKAAQSRSAAITAKAKEYGIPENLVTMLKIDDDADLDVYMKDAKQTFANLGFQGSTPPSPAYSAEKNSQDIADMINEGTKELIK
jgi:hypothetical protein